MCIKRNSNIRKYIPWRLLNRAGKTAWLQGGGGDFEGDIPKLDGGIDSFERLLTFFLSNVLEYAYDAEKGYFRKNVLFPHILSRRSCYGEDSDIYELAARTFIGASYLTHSAGSGEFGDIYLGIMKNGIDPSSDLYWGRINSDQIFAERLVDIVPVCYE